MTNHGVGRAVAAHVGRDLAAGYDYLPPRDAAVLRAWLDKPYCV